MKKLAWGFIVVLAIAHYDFWYWQDDTLVLGFMPIGLFYQAMISVLAGAGWLMVMKFAWPSDIEEWADLPAPGSPDGAGQGEVRQ